MAGDVLLVAPREATEPAPPSEPPPTPATWAFLAWGGAGYLLATFGVLLRALERTDGRLVYVIDDPAIHLSVARNLAEHGTWGVVPGHFESASSSPVWTVLLAGCLRVMPGLDSVAPLVLNVVASLGVIALFGWSQRALRPALRRPVDVVATVVLVTLVLFLPGLTFTGMEHTLHILLLVAAVVLFHRRSTGRPAPGPGWLPYALLAAATLARFETGFVAVGIALAMLVTEPGGGVWPSTFDRWRRPLTVVAAPALTFGVFALANVLMGQGVLPNSVLAKAPKTAAGPRAARDGVRPVRDRPTGGAAHCGRARRRPGLRAPQPGVELPSGRGRGLRAAAHAVRPGRLVRAVPGVPRGPKES